MRHASLLLLALSFAAVPAAGLANPWTDERAKAIVRIEGAGSIGTGTIVKGRNENTFFVLTSTHVLFPGIAPNAMPEPAPECSDKVPEGFKFTRELSGGEQLTPYCVQHLGKDVSVIKLEQKAGGYPSLPVYSRTLSRNDQVYLAGYPGGQPLVRVLSGPISGEGLEGTTVGSMTTAPGYSGGPFIMDDGLVIAVHRGTRAVGTAAMVPIWGVLDGLRRMGVEVDEEPRRVPSVDVLTPLYSSPAKRPVVERQPATPSTAYVAIDRRGIARDSHLETLRSIMEEVAEQISGGSSATEVKVIDNWDLKLWRDRVPPSYSHFIIATTKNENGITRVDFIVGKIRQNHLTELGRLAGLAYNIRTDPPNTEVVALRKDGSPQQLQAVGSTISTTLQHDLFPELSGSYRYLVKCFRNYVDGIRLQAEPAEFVAGLSEKLEDPGARGLKKTTYAANMSVEHRARLDCATGGSAPENAAHIVISGRFERRELKPGLVVIHVPVEVTHALVNYRWKNKDITLTQIGGEEMQNNINQNRDRYDLPAAENVPFTRNRAMSFCLGMQTAAPAVLPQFVQFVKSEGLEQLSSPLNCHAD
jgi:hypothetical protein